MSLVPSSGVISLSMARQRSHCCSSLVTNYIFRKGRTAVPPSYQIIYVFRKELEKGIKIYGHIEANIYSYRELDVGD